MSVFAGFAIVITEALYSFWKKFHAINFGIYGISQVGKTTLNHQLRTRGEVPDIKKRTVGLHRATRKQIKHNKEIHTVKTSDIGGEASYWKLWEKDIRKRGVKYIIFMIDDRHLQKGNMEHQIAWKFLIDLLCSKKWSNGKKKKRDEYPVAVSIWANKYDLWKDKHEYKGDIKDHPIFEAFKYGMRQLNDRGIPTFKYIVSAKSDPEMVYRGIFTMVDDY